MAAGLFDPGPNSTPCKGLGGLMNNPDRETDALAVCKTCPVLHACRRWVMAFTEADDPGGVCGGMTEAGREYQRFLASPAHLRQIEAGRLREARAEETYQKFAALRRRMSYSSAAVKLGISITLAGRLEDRRLAETETAEVAS